MAIVETITLNAWGLTWEQPVATNSYNTDYQFGCTYPAGTKIPLFGYIPNNASRIFSINNNKPEGLKAPFYYTYNDINYPEWSGNFRWSSVYYERNATDKPLYITHSTLISTTQYCCCFVSKNAYGYHLHFSGSGLSKIVEIEPPERGKVGYVILSSSTTSSDSKSGYNLFGPLKDLVVSSDAPDPNDQGGTSEPGGGGGNFDDTSDPIPLPPLPIVSATDCGLVTAFVPSRANLISLGNYLYSSLMDLDTLKRIFDQPMEHIIGLNILPFTPTTSSTKEITFANFSTGITGVPYISQQYQEVDCGALEVKEYWGSALDYSPNTRAYLWLPHIGFVQVDVDIIMNTTCRVVYRVDTVTGTCMAVLIVNGSVINHWTGELALNIPLSSADYSRVIGAILGIAGTAIGVGAAIGGAMKAGEALGAAETTLSGLSASGASGQMKAMAADALTGAATQYNEAKGALAVTVAKGSVNTVSDVMGAKLGIQMSGAISGQAGIMDVQKPYFLFIRPNQSLAENYKHYVGYPSNMYASVESCKGFTIFEQIELKGITATDSEIAEISKLLKGGFYG